MIWDNMVAIIIEIGTDRVIVWDKLDGYLTGLISNAVQTRKQLIIETDCN